MNYEPVVASTQSNGFAGTKASDNACQARKETKPVKNYILLPLWTADPPFFQNLKSSQDDGFKPLSDDGKKVEEDPSKGNECKNPSKGNECKDQEKEDNVNNTNNVNTVNAAGTNEYNELPFDPNMHALEDVSIFKFSNDDIVVDMNNMDTTIQVSPIPSTRIHKDHPLDQVIGYLHSATQTRQISKNLEEHGTQKGNSCIERSKPNRGYTGRASTIQVTRRFEDLDFPDRVYKVEKALYGLHQAPRAWESQIHAWVDGKEIIITDSSVRSDLRLADEEDEAVYKELDDTLVRATTTASSLEVVQDSGGGSRFQEAIGDTIAQTRFENVSKLSNDSLLTREKTKTTQALEITSLKKRVKKLEKKKRSRTHKLKRVYKGRKINDIDADEDITLVNDKDDAELFDVNDLHGEDVFVEKEVADKEAKGKAIMIEEPVKLNKKDQIRLDEDVALKLQAELQA
nr:reverse transcriptase [Tanacetum cinerariifolium]